MAYRLAARNLRSICTAAAVSMAATVPALAAVNVTLDFATLPSAQGWAFASSQPEGDTFTVAGGVLSQAAGGGEEDYYFQDGVVDPSLSFVLEARARPLSGGISMAFYFGVSAARGEMYLAPGAVYLNSPTNGFYELAKLDDSEFHDYRVVGSFGSNYQVFIDGTLVGSGDYFSYAAPYQLIIGDAGSLGEGAAELAEYSFRQPIPEPTTWALLLGGIAMLGIAKPRRRASSLQLAS